MFTTNPGDKYNYYYLFANGKVKDWRGSVTCLPKVTQRVWLIRDSDPDSKALSRGHSRHWTPACPGHRAPAPVGEGKTAPLPFSVLMAGPIIKIT